MKTVLHVIGSLDQGGAENVALDLCRSVPATEVRQVFYCFSGREGVMADSFRAAGASVIAAPSGNVLIRMLGLRQAVRSNKADVVVSHVSLASAFLMLSVRKLVGTRIARFHSTGDGKSGAHRVLYRQVARAIMPFVATHVLAVSQSSLSFAVGNWERMYRRLKVQTRVLPNGVDTQRFAFVVQDSNARPARVAHIGRASPEKNRVVLAQIFSALTVQEEKVEMWVVGPGGTSDLGRLPASEHFKVMGSVTDAAAILQQVDVLLLPSLREGLPGVVLEALASGVPVVASDLPTLRELSDLPGITLVKPEAVPEVWAAAVDRVIDMEPQERHRIAAVIGQSRFTLERSVRDWVDYWNSSSGR